MFYAGASFIMFLNSLYLLIIPPSDKEDAKKEADAIATALSILRVTFIIGFIVLASGFSIDIWTRYGINYLYIFELSQQDKVQHYTLYRIGMLLIFV